MHEVQSIKLPLKLRQKLETLTLKCQALEPGAAARLTKANVLRAMLELCPALPEALVAHILDDGLKRGNPHHEKSKRCPAKQSKPPRQPKCGECGGSTRTSGAAHDGKDVECIICGMPLCDSCAETVHEKKRGHNPEDCRPF